MSGGGFSVLLPRDASSWVAVLRAEVRELMVLPTEEELERLGSDAPNEVFPSDHFMIGARLAWKNLQWMGPGHVH